MVERDLFLGFTRLSVGMLSRLLKGGLRDMNCSRPGLGKAPYEQQGPRYNERYAQPLSHIESHSLLERHLVLLDELDEEPHAEKHYQEDAENGTGTESVESGSVEPHRAV